MGSIVTSVKDAFLAGAETAKQESHIKNNINATLFVSDL
jgi:hypothetical protein